ncbi:unnamed protein product [Eruca vesicaria subsp. sativa]|uniref:Uncharacterized protein n=1 Tax=Eruca vesicaria subsp. sativa TaxID=29727 RepID=A0ABC8M1S6_ERUVS|nr:unnamed protein product [Eruca vesicaria subsp. sativa]
MACSCVSVVRPSSHTYYTQGPQVSPTVLRSPCPKIDKSVAMAKESINLFQDYTNSMNKMIDIEISEHKMILRSFADVLWA